jgi:hypothetical protein
MKILKSLGRSILIAIITAVILFNLIVSVTNYGQMMFNEGRRYELNKSERAGGFLPTGDEKVINLETFVDSRHTG